jgi:hypothetical protein
MAQKIINIGTSANKGDGDPLRLAFGKINDNFTELYTGSPIVPQDLRGSVFGDDSTLLVDGVNSSIPKANIEDSTNWDTAFGWGNHSTAGYLTSYTVTESDVTTHQAALSITESQITDLAHYDDTALATRVTTLENAGYITSETDSQELTLVGTDLSISSGNTVDLSGFLTSYTETDPVVGAVTGIVKADGAGNISAAVAGTDYLTSVAFADLTTTPTTIAGYGITDALELGTTSTTALAGDTTLFDGVFASLTGKPTTLAGYGITDGGASFDQDLNTTDDVTFNSAALSSTLNLAVLAAEPNSPVNGMVAVADGTSWDPISNAAQTMVVYLGGAWRQIAVAGV